MSYEKVADVPIGQIVAALLNDFGESAQSAQSGRKGKKKGKSKETKAPKQITAATPEELAEIEELAADVGDLVDELGSRIGSLAAELKIKKDDLKQRMLSHGLGEVRVEGRPAIKLTVESRKDTTKKAIVGVLGAEDGAALWTSLPTKDSDSLSVPPKSAGDGPSE